MMRTQTARTGPEGRAQTNGFMPNEEEGRFNIRVSATSGTKTSNAIIAQVNTRGTGEKGPQAKSRSKMWTIIAIVGVAALTGGIVAAKHGGSSSDNTVVTVPVTISPGPVTVGGPR